MSNNAPNLLRNNNSSNAQGSGAGIFVFEADTAAFANRKRAARACVSCQKRKKRCPHTFSKSGDGVSTGGVGGTGASGDAAEKVLPNLTHKEPVRYLGDFNPESILTDLSTREQGAKKFARVGTWIEQSRIGPELLARDDEHHATVASGTESTANGTSTAIATTQRPNQRPYANIRRCAVERYNKVEQGRRTLTGHQKNYLQAVGAFRVLPKATEDVLVTTYIACIDPVLPIIDSQKFMTEYTSGEASVFLVQAICLVACKTEEAAPYLRLYEDGQLLDPIPFARSLHTGLDAAMKADLEADRFTKVQILALMSLHNDGPGGIEESSLHLVQAIHDAQSTGMHIDTPDRTRNDQGVQLWWTLWMLDKYNACLGGRPLMIAERDVDIQEPLPEPTAKSQALAVWMALGHLLDKIIVYYRPIADPEATGWEDDFPSWTTLTAHCNLDLLLPSHRSLLEVCYNIIGILACRSGGPSTTSYNRRIICSNRIQSLVSQGRQFHLSPIPLVPYAVSLSLTVAYRDLRDHHTDPTKALADLSVRCEMLEGLRTYWWTADAMAKLGRKALKSLQHQTQQHHGGRATDADIGSALEAEVSACKYGPFGNQITSPSTRVDPMGSNLEAPEIVSNGKGGSTGNALHVLSDAAATHGLHKATSKSKKSSTAERNNDNDIQAKRRRVNATRHSHSAIDALTPSSTNSGSMSSPNFNTNPSQLGLPATTTAAQLTPTYTNSPAITSSSNDLHSQLPAFSTSSGLLPTTNADALSIDPFPTFTDYNSLDILFDGFFDLAMPTIFQDPLFDGAAFFDTTIPMGGLDDDNFGYMNSFDYTGAGSVGMQNQGHQLQTQGLMDPRLGMSMGKVQQQSGNGTTSGAGLRQSQ